MSLPTSLGESVNGSSDSGAGSGADSGAGEQLASSLADLSLDSTTPTDSAKVLANGSTGTDAHLDSAAAVSNESVDSATRSELSPDSDSLTDASALYVGDLDLSTTDEQVEQTFAAYGQVRSINLARNNITKRPLGYAFVHFASPADAHKALADASNIRINSRFVKVQTFVRDRSLRKDSQQSSNIFIKNLSPAIDSDALYDTFSVFGHILSCKVATDEYGMSKGFAYVLFEHKTAADAAVEKMNGALVNDRRVYVCFHVSRRDRLSKIEELKANYTNLYVKSIDPTVTEDEFKLLFSKYGNIVSFSLPLDPETAHSRGFGFVNFDSHECAAKAVQELDGFEFKGKKLYVNRAQKKYEREEELRQQTELARLDKLPKFQGVNLYIKFLDSSIDDAELKQIFSSFGTIVSAKVMTDDAGRSRGFGFVCYSSPDEAHRAIAKMNEFELKHHRLYVAVAQRKEQDGGTPPISPAGSPLVNRGLFSPRAYGRQPPAYPGASNPAAAYAAFAAYAAAAAATASATAAPPNLNMFTPEFAAQAAANPFAFMPLQYNGGYPPVPMHPQQLPQYYGKSPLASPQLRSQGGGVSSPNGGSLTPSSRNSSPSLSPAPGATPATPNPNEAGQNLPSASPGNSTARANVASPNVANPYMSPQYYYHPASPFFGSPGGSQAAWAASSQALMAAAAANSPRLNGQGGYRPRQPSGKRNSAPHNGSNGTNGTTGTSSNGKKQNGHNNGQYGRYNKYNKEPIGGSSLSAAVASAADPEAEKQVIGEAIYRKVVSHPVVKNKSDAAAKVTGMLLEQDKDDLLKWIDDDKTLDQMIREAYEAYAEFVRHEEKTEDTEEKNEE